MVPQTHPDSRLAHFFSAVKMSRILVSAGIHKARVGVAPIIILQFLLGLIFTQRNFWRWLQMARPQELPFHKDVVYRFLNDPRWHWRRLLAAVSIRASRDIRPLTRHVAVFALDDSLYDRSRSKAVALMGPVFDHVSQRMRKGFRWLALVWTDGRTVLPVDFALLTTAQATQRYPAQEGIDPRSPGAGRRREAIQPAPTVAVSLLQHALAVGFEAAYVVCDRWFTTPKLVSHIVRETGCDVIGMLKNSALGFEWKDRRYTLAQLYRTARAHWTRHDLQGSVVVTVPTETGPLRVKLVFIRDRRGHSREWLALLSTDLSLPDDEVVRLYGKRWDIETFFKASKSLLGLAKEIHSRSYDALIAHTTIVCLRYLFLAREARQNDDYRTIGALFFVMVDELQDLLLATVWDHIMAAFEATLHETLELSPAQVEALYAAFLQRLPQSLRDRLGPSRLSRGFSKPSKAA